MKKLVPFFIVLFYLFLNGCAAMDKMNDMVANSSSMIAVMQNFTVQGIQAIGDPVNVMPTDIKIVPGKGSYVSGSNWTATLPDGRKYYCNKMREEKTACIKLAEDAVKPK